MRRILTGLFLLASCGTGLTNARPVEHKKICAALGLPTIELDFSLGFRIDRGLELPGEKSMVPVEIARLREQVRKNPNDFEAYCQLSALFDSMDDSAKSRKYSERAEKVLRSVVAAKPTDGFLLAKLANTL